MSNPLKIIFLMLSLAVSIHAAAHTTTVGSASDCGYIKSLRMDIISGTVYAVIITSDPKRITGTASDVGLNDGYGGMTYINLPSNATERSLAWASLDRALHNRSVHFYWKSADISNIRSGNGNIWEVIVQEWVLGSDL